MGRLSSNKQLGSGLKLGHRGGAPRIQLKVGLRYPLKSNEKAYISMELDCNGT